MAVPRKLVAEALELPEEDRETLLHALLESFPGEAAAPELTPAELAELDAALAAADRGPFVSAEHVLERVRKIP